PLRACGFAATGAGIGAGAGSVAAERTGNVPNTLRRAAGAGAGAKAVAVAGRSDRMASTGRAGGLRRAGVLVAPASPNRSSDLAAALGSGLASAFGSI